MNDYKKTVELIDREGIYERKTINIMDIAGTNDRLPISGCEQSKKIIDSIYNLKGEFKMNILIESCNSHLNKVGEHHQRSISGIDSRFNIKDLTHIEMRYCYYRFTMTYSVEQIHVAMKIAQSTQKTHYRDCCVKYNIGSGLDKGVKAAIMQNYWITEFPNWKDIVIIIAAH